MNWKLIKTVSRVLASLCLLAGLATSAALANEGNFKAGVCLYKQEKYKSAIARFDKALKANGVDYRAYFFKARCQDKLGEREGAKNSYIRAVQFGYKTKVGNEAAKILSKRDKNAYLISIGAGKKFLETRGQPPVKKVKASVKTKKKASQKKTAESK